MKKEILIGQCPDCGAKEVELTSDGLCKSCKIRKYNMRYRNREYIPYLKLSKKERAIIDAYRARQAGKKKTITDTDIEIPMPNIPIIENYYEVKATQNPAIAHVVEKPITVNTNTETEFNPLSDSNSFIAILKECGCTISDETLKDVLQVLLSTDKLKDIFMTIAKSDSQQAILDLEQILNAAERKLQHVWEYNGFQEIDDLKFKGFLTWRRVLKGAIFFWKKLYQTNTIIEMQRAWNSYTQDPSEKILLVGDRAKSTQRRFQITTESISTIFNTKRPFTRVFYAESKDDAYKQFVQWMADRQLHENKGKTTITELTK